MSRPFNIATKEGADNAVAKDFINFILSEEGQKVVADNGYISLDEAKPYEGSARRKSGCWRLVFGCARDGEVRIEAYKTVNDKAEIELQSTDSTTGMTSAIDAVCDIGMASRVKDTETSEGLVPR